MNSHMSYSSSHSDPSVGKSLAEHCQETTLEVRDLIPEIAWELAKSITIFDLLASDIARCETMSMISNIPRYWQSYGIKNNGERDIAEKISDIKENMPHRAFKKAFNVTGSIKDATREMRLIDGHVRGGAVAQRPIKVARKAPEIIPPKPTKRTITKEDISRMFEAFMKKCEAEKLTQFKFSEFCNIVEVTFLESRIYQWNNEDKTIGGANTPYWKQKVSNSLQVFAKEQRVVHLTKKDVWHILPTD